MKGKLEYDGNLYEDVSIETLGESWTLDFSIQDEEADELEEILTLVMPRVTDTTENGLVISGFVSAEEEKETLLEQPIPGEAYRFVSVTYEPYPEFDGLPRLTVLPGGKGLKKASGRKAASRKVKERSDKRKDGPEARGELRICGLTLDPERTPRLVHSFSCH